MIPWLSGHPDRFPSVDQALTEPNGLLAVGGDLSVARLLAAYRRGIFPWYSAGEPILWWSPDPRLVLYPQEFKYRRSLAKSWRARGYRVTVNQAFDQIIALCASTRREEGTWIHPEMRAAYRQLYQRGAALSAETWDGDTLVGGLYGVKLGQVLFGESMVSVATDASKVALAHLCQQADLYQIALIDCQMPTAHLASLGARLISRTEFLTEVRRWHEPL
ncbi:MAG: leucyl/phenylalanyl-tRNA--protein transferase [Gammaproteobacteria bacterium]|nr:leucyl/phenylalanyl-tRNA--protein transferase [Gammaproteobacteria bacterium]